jgi:hypothetical protein
MLRRPTIMKLVLFISCALVALPGSLLSLDSFARPAPSLTLALPQSCPGVSDADLLEKITEALKNNDAFKVDSVACGGFFRGGQGRVRLQILVNGGAVTVKGFAKRRPNEPITSAKDKVIQVVKEASCGTAPNANGLGVNTGPGCGPGQRECNGVCIANSSHCPFGN